MKSEPNLLIHASSPYLLQHAYNPVKWQEWGEAALTQAKAENKLIIVSIGYSACHWCHVMERESFENHEVAEVMNQHFVCIKIDREERPDIDQVYMLAVQLMGLNGGWPLNCICLPDQRPIYGGTYFPKADWINVLESVAKYWKNEPAQALAYADKLETGIHAAERIAGVGSSKTFTESDLKSFIEPWKRSFDMAEGGYTRAPKFPLPNNWLFLLRAGFLLEDEALSIATLLTLDKMAMGGIYDQIAGGFSRYSVDDRWHVPHFEKMLYDNAQLISLYAEAWQFSKLDRFKNVAMESIEWVHREMTSADGLFYSALDADSEGVEGKFYIWTLKELEDVLGPDSALAADYYQSTQSGNWHEMSSNILLRKEWDSDFAERHALSVEQWNRKLTEINTKLHTARIERVPPHLDDKCLSAWNGLMIKALAESALIMSMPIYYDRAKRAMTFILKNIATADGGLNRNFKNGHVSIAGFLDDYAFTISALITLYQYDFDELWLSHANKFTDYVLENFSDPDSPMFFYTNGKSEKLIARKHEIMDNVIPSSNSEMSQNLILLGLLFDKPAYTERGEAMLNAVYSQLEKYPSGYSNWAIQLLNQVEGITEIALTGESTNKVKMELMDSYIPNKILLGGTKSTLPLLENKPGSAAKIYICKNKTCNLPVDSVSEALSFINKL